MGRKRQTSSFYQFGERCTPKAASQEHRPAVTNVIKTALIISTTCLWRWNNSCVNIPVTLSAVGRRGGGESYDIRSCEPVIWKSPTWICSWTALCCSSPAWKQQKIKPMAHTPSQPDFCISFKGKSDHAFFKVPLTEIARNAPISVCTVAVARSGDFVPGSPSCSCPAGALSDLCSVLL